MALKYSEVLCGFVLYTNKDVLQLVCKLSHMIWYTLEAAVSVDVDRITPI